jgi:hypothetical protein
MTGRLVIKLEMPAGSLPDAAHQGTANVEVI